LPAGITLNSSTGVVSGTPTGSGTSVVTFGVKDALNVASATTGTFTFNVDPTVTATSTSLTQLFAIGLPMTQYQPLTASGGQPPYTYFVSSGVLPVGLTLNATTGVVSGTPSVSGTSNVTFNVRDSLNRVASTSRSVIFTVYPAIIATASITTTQ
jgi:hypothetical protein